MIGELRFLGSIIVLAGAIALGLPATAAAQNDFRFGPPKGGTKTTFTVQFTAPLSERNGPGGDPLDFYVVEVGGPAGCLEVAEYTTEIVLAGQPVTLTLDPADIMPFGEVSSWCPGRYTGSVYFCYCEEGDPRPNVPVGSFSFVISQPARARKYVGRTSQRKRISFTLSASRTRITGLRVRFRERCRVAGGGSFRASIRWATSRRQDRRWPTRVRRGRFKRTYKGKFRSGVRWSLTVTGRRSGNRFRGRLRGKESGRVQGRRVRCDSGKVRWSARPR